MAAFLGTVRIVAVTPWRDRGWKLRDSSGGVYVTKDRALAELAQRCCDLETPVRLYGASGWYYTTLQQILIPPETEATP